MPQANIDHSISGGLPTVCATLSLLECRALYFTALQAATTFVAATNMPIAMEGSLQQVLQGYADAMQRLGDEIAAAVEGKPVHDSTDAESKFEVLVHHHSQGCGDYARATQAAVSLLSEMNEGGRH